MAALPKLEWGGDRRVKASEESLNSDSPADAVLAPGSLLQRCNKLQSTWRRSRTGAAVVGRRQQLWKRVTPVLPFYSHGRGREGKQLVSPVGQVHRRGSWTSRVRCTTHVTLLVIGLFLLPLW